MNHEMIMKKCSKCGAIIKVIQEGTSGNSSFSCCGEKMETMKANSFDAAFEKHVPTYEIEDGVLKVFVPHVMEEDHFIE